MAKLKAEYEQKIQAAKVRREERIVKWNEKYKTELQKEEEKGFDKKAKTLESAKEKAEKEEKALKAKYQKELRELNEPLTATVEVEVEVTDYSKSLAESEDYLSTNKAEFQDETGNYSEEKYNDYRLGLLKDVDEKVKYTITFNLTKIDDEWTIEDLSDEDQQKLLGIYRS